MGYNTMFERPRVYDAFYADKEYAAETEMMIKQIELTCPNPSRVLVVGCGTGNHIPGLLEAGYDVVGIDKSEAMIERARALHPDVSFYSESLPGLAVDGPFDAILLPFSVVHFIEREDLITGLEELDELLAPNGTLVLDILENYDSADVELTVRRRDEADYCFLTKVMPQSDQIDRYQYIVLTDGGAERGTVSFDVFDAKIHHHPWLPDALEELGFQVDRYDGYNTGGWLDSILEVLVCHQE